MTFVCPYCKHKMEGELSRRCTNCGKVMNIPDKYFPGSEEEKRRRKSKKKQIKKIGEKQKFSQAPYLPDFFAGRRKPLHVAIPLILLVVVGALLLGRVGQEMSEPSRTRRELVAMGELEAIRMGLELFKHDCGRYPTEEEGLKALVRDPGVQGWAGYYVRIMKPDPWYTKYRYSVDNGEVTVFSCGKDRKCGTEDDIYAEEPDPEIMQEHIQRQEERKKSG